MPLDPLNLTPAASLNRVPLVAPPGEELAGAGATLAYDLLSRDALVDQIRAHAAELHLDTANVEEAQLPRLLGACCGAEDAAVRGAAERVAKCFGRRLAALLLALERGDTVSRAARPDWDDSYWAYWAAIRSVRLGGGIASGAFGARLVQAARDTLVQAGSRIDLRVARFAAALPLLGAARGVAAGFTSALVFDFGQTSAKRALARFAGDELAELRLLAAVPTRWMPQHSFAPQNQPDDQQRLAESLAELLVQTWQQHTARQETVAPVLVCSVASYVAHNQPLARQGGLYGELYRVSDNLGSWLSNAASTRLERGVSVELLHDGTAAARAVAGEPRCAVITMGTALGIGFAPPADGLRAMASRFGVVDTEA